MYYYDDEEDLWQNDDDGDHLRYNDVDDDDDDLKQNDDDNDDLKQNDDDDDDLKYNDDDEDDDDDNLRSNDDDDDDDLRYNNVRRRGEKNHSGEDCVAGQTNQTKSENICRLIFSSENILYQELSILRRQLY